MKNKMASMAEAAHSRSALRVGRQEEARGTMQALNALSSGPSARISTNGLVLNPYNSRTIYTPEKVSARAASLLNAGQAQPILVAEMSDGQRIVVDGWTRKLASEQLAQDESLPLEKREQFERIDAVVRMDLTMQDIAVLSFVANEEHNSLTDMDRALVFSKALESRLFPTQEAMAAAYGIAQTTISRLKNMASTPEPIRNVLMANPEKLSYSFVAEVTASGLDTAEQCTLLTEVAANDRSRVWLRRQVAHSQRVRKGAEPTSMQRQLPAATLKWSTSSRAKSIEVVLRSKTDQLGTLALLEQLFQLSDTNRTRLRDALADEASAQRLLSAAIQETDTAAG